jgi:AraC-like DNA-binding protein
MERVKKEDVAAQALVFSDLECLIDEIAMVGWHDLPRARVRGLVSSQHPDAYEICFVARGTVEWWNDTGIVEVGPGKWYVTRPGEANKGADAVMHPGELYWVQVRLEQGFSGLSEADRRAISSGLDGLSYRSFPAADCAAALFQTIVNEHANPGPLSETAVRGALMQLLVCVVRDHAAHVARYGPAPGTFSKKISLAMAHINEHLTETVSVPDLAHVAGLSVSHFHRQFLHEVGYPPADYQTRQRVRRARELLQHSAEKVTAISDDLGFCSSQYFATVFKHMVGLTPNEYRKLHHGAG